VTRREQRANSEQEREWSERRRKEDGGEIKKKLERGQKAGGARKSERRQAAGDGWRHPRNAVKDKHDKAGAVRRQDDAGVSGEGESAQQRLE